MHGKFYLNLYAIDKPNKKNLIGSWGLRFVVAGLHLIPLTGPKQAANVDPDQTDKCTVLCVPHNLHRTSCCTLNRVQYRTGKAVLL